jgi:hypothetical protein
MERIVLLLSYLIKITRITTNIITTTTAPIPPAIEPILVFWGSDEDGCTTIQIKIKIVFHCWIKLLIYSALAVFLMYFTIKYNVFNKYIINATTTAINACKKVALICEPYHRTKMPRNKIFSFYNFKEVQNNKVNKFVIDSTITKSYTFYDVCLFFSYRFYYLAPLPVLDPIYPCHLYQVRQ